MMPEKDTFALFNTRLKRHETELRELYGKLYHDEQAYLYFADMLRRMWAERNDDLKALDEVRERYCP